MQAAKLIGSSPLISNYAYSCNFFNPNSVYAQCIRFRKPIWLPTAKSKVFRVPKRPEIPKDEAEEIKRLYNNYRTYYRSVVNYLKGVNKQNEIQLDEEHMIKIEEDDYNKCYQINEEWNKKVAAERVVRLEQQRENKRLQILSNIQTKKERDEKIKQEVEEKVRAAKLLAPTLITRENIDQAIEDALAEIVDYNKALNPDGSWYTDATGLLPVKTEEKKIQQVNQ